MKRFLVRILPLALAAVLLTAVCGAAVAEEPVTLRIQHWGLGTEEENNIWRQTFAAFEAEHPGVTIEIVTIPLNADGSAGDYDSYLVTQAAERNLPDVFMRWACADTVAKGWALDVTEYAEADPSWAAVVQSLRESGKYNGHVYGVPVGMFLFGFIQNYTLMEDINVEPLPYDYTLDELLEKIGECTTDKYRGTDNFRIEDWGPFVMAPEKGIGFGAFDGSRFNYTAPEFARSIDIVRDLAAKGWTGNGTFVDPWLPEGVGWAFGEGYIGVQFDGSWSAGMLLAEDRKFDGDFYPLPDGKMVVVPDYMFVGANTEHPALAYELLAYMGYNVPGTLAKIDIIRTNNADPSKNVMTYPGMPLSPGFIPEADAFVEESYAGLPGLLKMYADLGSDPGCSIVEAAKYVPGYLKARFNDGDTGMVDENGAKVGIETLLNMIMKGEKNLADYAQQIEELANRYYQDALDELEGK
jgi:ABC-type glycerol-3-phosphate transport system substrate-binding protein